MTETPIATRRWLDALWPFVREHLPPAPARVLEVGCGPSGGFVPAMRENGYDAHGVDPAAPSGAEYHPTLFEHYQPGGPLDAIVACTSLHHVDDVDAALAHAGELLRPGGVLIVVEWAYERFDEATARWCFDRLPDGGEPGWLHEHRDQWADAGRPWDEYLTAWAEREGLHRGETLVHGLRRSFHTRLLTAAPYFFADLAETTEADEQAAADTGDILAGGIRYVGMKPLADVAAVGVVHNERFDPQNSDHWGDVESTIVIDAVFGDRCLTGLADFSHVEVVYLFDRLAERDDYRQLLRPRNRPDLPEVGVFADRGPRRPNRIGCTICEVVQVDGRQLRVRGLDAIDGTPVLDIKPVMRQFVPGTVRQPPWVDELMAQYFEPEGDAR